MAGLYDLLPAIRMQFSDANGNPYASGKLYFYATGTTTPQNVYADSPPTTVLNDVNGLVTLDSAGRLAACYLQPLAYKVVLKDSADNTIFTEDPVIGSDLAKFAAYKSAAMSGGAATVTAEQDLTGATVSLDQNGIWFIIGVFDISIDASAAAASCVGYLNLDGSNQTATAISRLSTTGQTKRETISQTWIVTVSAQPKTAKLRAIRDTGTGTVTITDVHTAIRAIYLGAV